MKTRVTIYRAGDCNPQAAVFVPSDHLAEEECRTANLRFGREYMATFTKSRNPGFHRLAHAFGKLMQENTDAFAETDAHDVLKRLQVEADAGCRNMVIDVDGMQVIHRLPKSLSYASMDETEFNRVIGKIAHFAAGKYFDFDTTADDLIQMATKLAENAHA